MNRERIHTIDLGLHLGLQELCLIRDTLVSRMREGLRKDGGEIAMLPAFLPPPVRQLSGRAVAVDAGGTNLRAARVELGGQTGSPVIGEVAMAPLPGSAGQDAVGAEQFLAAHVEVLAVLGVDAGTPLGYCFSYPILSQPDGDAVLTKWTKEVRVSGMVGKPVGLLLRQYLESHGVRPGPIAVLNDTIATLVAGASAADVVPTRCCGLVVGTGTNMGAFLPTGAIDKLGSIPWQASHMAVNFESGGYSPPGLGPVDEEVDRTSVNPGDHRFEKAVSGAYVGQVFEVAARMSGIPCTPGEVTAAQVSQLAAQNKDAAENRLARSILGRSADLVAAALAATDVLLAGSGDLTVCAEGALFWKGPGYARRVETTLTRLLEEGCRPDRCRVLSVDNANLVGSAAAVMTRQQSEI